MGKSITLPETLALSTVVTTQYVYKAAMQCMHPHQI